MAAVPGIDRLTREVPAGAPLEQLAAAAELADQLRARGDELLDRFVDAARHTGASWTEIGCALGTSKQAAHERFSALADPPPGQPPFGLSGTALEVLTAAATEARALGHHAIGPEHLVLGLLALRDELASQALVSLGVDRDAVRARVGERLGTATPRAEGSLGVSPQTKRLLELARAIAKSLGCRCSKTEHILLAATAPKLRSPAAALLADVGATPDQIREQLARMMVAEAPELAERLRNRSWFARLRIRTRAI
jgi:hypothetical protein